MREPINSQESDPLTQIDLNFKLTWELTAKQVISYLSKNMKANAI